MIDLTSTSTNTEHYSAQNYLGNKNSYFCDRSIFGNAFTAGFVDTRFVSECMNSTDCQPWLPILWNPVLRVVSVQVIWSYHFLHLKVFKLFFLTHCMAVNLNTVIVFFKISLKSPLHSDLCLFLRKLFQVHFLL